MGENNRILSDTSDRNKIIDDHIQKSVRIKLTNNSKDVDPSKKVFIQEVNQNGFSRYMKISGKEIKLSNIEEIAEEDGEILWRKKQ